MTIVAYLALSKGGSSVHYPRVATIQGWIWGPLSKGGHYPRVATIQGWPLSKGGSGVHYPRVAIIQGWIMGPLSKGGHYSRAGHYPRAGRAADTRNALSTFCKGAHKGGRGHNGGGFPGRGQGRDGILQPLARFSTSVRNSSKIENPSRVFSTPGRDTSTPRALFRPRTGIVSKWTTPCAFFRHRDGILRPLRAFFRPRSPRNFLKQIICL